MGHDCVAHPPVRYITYARVGRNVSHKRLLRTTRIGFPSLAPGADRRGNSAHFSKLGAVLPYILESKWPKGKNSSRNLLNTLGASRPTPL